MGNTMDLFRVSVSEFQKVCKIGPTLAELRCHNFKHTATVPNKQIKNESDKISANRGLFQV